MNKFNLINDIDKKTDSYGYGSFIDLAKTLGFNEEVVDMNNRSCSNCNSCCSVATPLLEDEFVKIKKYLQNTKQGKVAMKEAISRIKKNNERGIVSMICPFSNKSRKCSIYSIRPQVCREFHCDKELHKNFDKDKFHSVEHKVINDLFR